MTFYERLDLSLTETDTTVGKRLVRRLVDEVVNAGRRSPGVQRQQSS